MAGQASPYYPKRKEYQILGLHQVMSHRNSMMLRQVLLWGTPRRQSGQFFSEYLRTTKGISQKELKRFDKGQQHKMDNDIDMNSFDVTLIHLCLKFGTDGLAPPNSEQWNKAHDSLEGRLTLAKDFRNAFIHGEYVITDQLYIDKIEGIRKLLTKIIHEAAQQFGISQSEVTPILKDFNEELDRMKDLPDSAIGLTTEQLCTLLKVEGRIELEEKYKSQSSISPASSLLGEKIQVEVTQIFTNIEIKSVNSTELLELERLFVHVNSLGSKKNLLIIEGVAGAGKTTLTRMILQEWAKRNSKMKNLDNYDLAIWTECRDGSTRSLAQLLYSLMPNATKEIRGDAEVVKCIQNSELLFIVDGLDELNASSQQVLREILALQNADIITIICTTRPNKIPDIKKYVPNTFEIKWVKILGIAEEDREAFVLNYLQALESHIGTSGCSGLIPFVKQNKSHLQEHLRLPFNLVLLTILWVQDPNIINEMTTGLELILQTVELCKERLIQRLQNKEPTSRMSSNDIREKLAHFLKQLSSIAFASHCYDETVLSHTSVTCLKDACDSQQLPYEEVLGAFLVQTTSLIDGNLEKISFPHKGLQDFFCALHIEEALDPEGTNLNIPGIISSIEQVLLKEKVPKATIPSLVQEFNRKFQEEATNACPTVRSVFEEALKGVAIRNPTQRVQLDLSKWRNILVHLTGLLYHRGRSLTDERAGEMVKLLEESGITDSDEWFDFLSNVKCDAAISKHIVLKGDIKVTDARVEAFLKVFNQALPTRVSVAFKGDPSTATGLKELLMALREKDWRVTLYLHHDFQFPKKGGSILDGTLLELFRSNLGLERFKGQLSASALKELPSSVSVLLLSVNDGAHFRSLLPALTLSTEKRKGMWAYLCLHVPVDIDESSLRPLPQMQFLDLFVSDVGEATVEKASVVSRALLPYGERYYDLCFPGVGRTTTECERLIHQLSQRGVEVGGGVSVSPEMDEGERQRMIDLARRMLNCGFKTYSDDFIWNLVI